jgi:hypothetical protein
MKRQANRQVWEKYEKASRQSGLGKGCKGKLTKTDSGRGRKGKLTDRFGKRM